jgi:hypothetical protein
MDCIRGSMGLRFDAAKPADLDQVIRDPYWSYKVARPATLLPRKAEFSRTSPGSVARQPESITRQRSACAPAEKSQT